MGKVGRGGWSSELARHIIFAACCTRVRIPHTRKGTRCRISLPEKTDSSILMECPHFGTWPRQDLLSLQRVRGEPTHSHSSGLEATTRGKWAAPSKITSDPFHSDPVPPFALKDPFNPKLQDAVQTNYSQAINETKTCHIGWRWKGELSPWRRGRPRGSLKSGERCRLERPLFRIRPPADNEAMPARY